MEGGRALRKTLYDFCIRTGQQTLLQEWDAEPNAPLTPRDLSYGSKKKVWWRCAHGHVWQAMVTIRTANHSGCPYCSHQRPWPGENDLKTLCIRILQPNGIASKTEIYVPSMYCRAAGKRCGGFASMVMSGGQW